MAIEFSSNNNLDNMHKWGKYLGIAVIIAVALSEDGDIIDECLGPILVGALVYVWLPAYIYLTSKGYGRKIIFNELWLSIEGSRFDNLRKTEYRNQVSFAEFSGIAVLPNSKLGLITDSGTCLTKVNINDFSDDQVKQMMAEFEKRNKPKVVYNEETAVNNGQPTGPSGADYGNRRRIVTNQQAEPQTYSAPTPANHSNRPHRRLDL